MNNMRVKPYEKLAFVYDHLMSHVNYDLWADYIYDLSKPFLNKKSSILELAGGNGRFSDIFLKFYPNIIISDRSFEMLSSGKNNLSKVCCEMQSLPFKSKFDFIYSTFDSINYLTSKKELLKLFTEIYNILSEEGIFTFDVSLEKNSLKHAGVPVRTSRSSKIRYKHLSLYNKSSRIHKNIFEIKFNGNTYKEIHKQKIYPFELYFDLLERANLFVINCYESFSFEKAKPSSQRAQFVVRKFNNAVI